MRICVDGNIAAGKTTALDAIAAAFPRIPTYPEPVSEWNDLLSLYYEDPATWSLALNLRVLLSFLDVQEDAFVERSPASCRHVFSQVSYNDGTFDAHQWEVFKGYYDAVGWKPDALIFVDAPAATCLDRVGARDRPCEVGQGSSLDFEYLKKLEFQYGNMLKMLEKDQVPIVVIDGTQSREKVRAAAVAAAGKLLALGD